MAKLVFKNEFGEQYESAEDLEQIADSLPAKTGVEALTALALDADLPTAVLKINEIIAALKVVS